MHHALTLVACVSLAVAFICALWIAFDELKHPQKMWIMNVVWPVTALYLSVGALWFYYAFGRNTAKKSSAMRHAGHEQKNKPGSNPSWQQIAISDFHCGAGCSLADIVCEYLIFAWGLTLFGAAIWASYALDFAGAWLLGILFQYFAIKPMSDLSAGQALIAAIKADTLSIIAFQIGMYAWMALVHFVWFPHPHLEPNEFLYWFLMQLAMIAGFLTAFPMNAWLIRRGVKEAMG
ncbi:MAG TPA: DUF4396 domain-containing protein [Candidatus Acidoferrum sp.]|jgi:hypothetical protein